MPYGHGLNWKEPTNYDGLQTGNVYGGKRFDQHMKDAEWHPDDILRGTTTSDLPYSEPTPVPLDRSWWPRTCDPHVYLSSSNY